MRLTGNNSRFVYGQAAFAWNFDVIPNSDNFYVNFRGSSSSGGVRFNFSRGKILDEQDRFIWSYNKGDLVKFEVSASGGNYEYAINGMPIDRIKTHVSPLDRFEVNVLDSGYTDYNGSLLGTSPIYGISNINGISGYSGRLENYGSYPIRIFNVRSPQDVPGTQWSWTSVINPGQTGWFKTTGQVSYGKDFLVPLDFNFNFGDVSVVRNVVSGIEPIPETISPYMNMTLLSGENPLNTSRTLNETYVYKYIYTYTGGGSVTFDLYTFSGLTGNALVKGYGIYYGGYSGWIYANAGTGWGQGYLTGTDVKFWNSGYVLDSNNTGAVLFDGPKQMYYANYLTGFVSIVFNPRNDWIANRSIIPIGNVNLSVPYQSNVGLTWTTDSTYGTVTGAALLPRYTTAATETGIFNINSTSYQGKYTFTNVSYQRSGVMQYNSLSGNPNVVGVATVPFGFAIGEIKNLTTQIPITGGLYNGQVATGYISPSWCKKLYISRFITNYTANGQVIFTGGTMFSGGLPGYDRATESDPINSDGIKYSPWNFGQDWMPDRDYEFTDARQQAITKLKSPITSINRGLANPFGDYYEQDEFGIYESYEPFVKLGTMMLIRRPDVFPEPADFTLFYSGTNTKVPYEILNYWEQITPSQRELRPFVFTGILNTSTTGYITAGYPKLRISVSGFSNFYTKGPLFDYSANAEIQKVTHPISGTNYMITKTFRTTQNGTFNKNFNPSQTVYLQSGYYKFTDPVISRGTGIYSGFIKNPQTMWQMSISNDVNGPYVSSTYLTPPLIYHANAAVTEITKEGYLKISYSGKRYDDINPNVRNTADLVYAGTDYAGQQLVIDTSRVDLVNEPDVEFPIINGIVPGDGKSMVFSTRRGVRINSSNEVYQWDDLSGNNFHAIQGTAINRPGLSQIGSELALLFDGTNNFFNIPGAVDILRNRGYFYIITCVEYTSGSVYRTILNISTSVASQVRGNLWISNGNIIQSFFRTNDAGGSNSVSNSTTDSGTSVILVKHLFADGNSFIKVNDLPQISTSYSPSNTSNASSNIVKLGHSNGTNHFNGKISCLAVICPDNPITTEEEASLIEWASSHR